MRSNGSAQFRLLEQADKHYQDKQWNMAVEAYSALARENPYHGTFQIRLGEIHYHLKDYEASTKAFKAAVKLGHNVPHAMYGIGRNLAMQNHPDKAAEWLERALGYRFAFLRDLVESPDWEGARGNSGFARLLPPKVPDDTPRRDGWRTDLAYLTRRMVEGHYEAFGRVSRRAWYGAIRRLHGKIPELEDHEIIVQFMRLVAMVGDGHTCISFPPPSKFRFHRIPVMFYEFQDGVFVMAAASRYRDLVGSRVLGIGSVPIRMALRELTGIMARDNDMTIKWARPFLLTYPAVLHALGIALRTDRLDLSIQRASGEAVLTDIEAEPSQDPFHYRVARPGWATARDDAEVPSPLWLRDPDNPFWFEYLEEAKIVYAQFNQVRDKLEEPLSAFCGRLFEFIDLREVRALVLDIRLNNGGNLLLNRSLIHGIVRCDKINQRGRLFTIIGRRTFSAAMYLAAQLEVHTRTIFVGEPTGSSPNFIGEDNVFTLPYSGMNVSASNLAWQGSFAFDDRVWIAPEIVAELTSADFKSNRDPAMDAILTCLAGQG